MDIDELEPGKRPAKPKDLASYSTAELRHYVEQLKAEIRRAETAIAHKEAHKDAVGSLFKS